MGRKTTPGERALWVVIYFALCLFLIGVVTGSDAVAPAAGMGLVVAIIAGAILFIAYGE